MRQIVFLIISRYNIQLLKDTYDISDSHLFLLRFLIFFVCVFFSHQARLGTKWAAIAREMPGRTEHAVKGRVKVRCERGGGGGGALLKRGGCMF